MHYDLFKQFDIQRARVYLDRLTEKRMELTFNRTPF
jgi:hypothetical protein